MFVKYVTDRARTDGIESREVQPPRDDRALQYNQNQRKNGHADKIEEAVKHLYHGFPDDHPYSQLHLPCSGESTPETWLRGSSPNSAAIAGRLGLPYCFVGFIRPDVALQAFEAYRENFDPSPFDASPDKPVGMLGVNVSCDETDQGAARLRASVEAYYQRLNRGEIGSPPSVDVALDELGRVPDPTPDSLQPVNSSGRSLGAPPLLGIS